jgi:hypothetical protein
MLSTLTVNALRVVMILSLLWIAKPAIAADAVLYEVSEAVTLQKFARFKSADAVLAGAVRVGSALCPEWVAAAFKSVNCSVVVRAIGQADDRTGVGPVNGKFQVVAQDRNHVDAPEISIMTGQLKGKIDLSAAFLHQQPLGSISGDWEAKGVDDSPVARFHVKGAFVGVFRLPFDQDGRPSYLLDDGTTVAVGPAEMTIGTPSVRLEVTFE